MMKLTDIKCKTAKAQDKQYKLYDGQGLYLLVKTNGSRYWRYKYRIDGKESIFAIGVYPEVTLNEARIKHKEAHKAVSEGILN